MNNGGNNIMHWGLRNQPSTDISSNRLLTVPLTIRGELNEETMARLGAAIEAKSDTNRRYRLIDVAAAGYTGGPKGSKHIAYIHMALS